MKMMWVKGALHAGLWLSALGLVWLTAWSYGGINRKITNRLSVYHGRVLYLEHPTVDEPRDEALYTFGVVDVIAKDWWALPVYKRNPQTQMVRVDLPLVYPAILCALGGGWMTLGWVRRRRRASNGGCPGCGYPLEGMGWPVCPECGVDLG
jgi:hypothetical protein